MDITFLVGNGFDISTGIDTSYNGFYQWYCMQKPDNEPEWIRDFKTDILKDLEKPLEERTWADFELGLGRYTTNFSPETVDHFIDCYEDAVTNLQRYIELQIENKVQDISSSQKDAFAKSILDFTDEVPEASKVVMSPMLPGIIQENVRFHFISFNYTRVLDNFVEAVASAPLTTWTVGVGCTAKADPKILHIHGSINDLPLMGVNDVGQIKNSILQNNIDLQQCIIKPLASSVLGETVQSQAKQLIKKSTIICLWGLSIGDTDAQWWEEIMDWLSKGKEKQLIVFWYTGGKVTKRLHTKILKARQEIYKKFFDYSSFTREEMEEAKKRIHIVFDTQKVLRVNLLEKELSSSLS